MYYLIFFMVHFLLKKILVRNTFKTISFVLSCFFKIQVPYVIISGFNIFMKSYAFNFYHLHMEDCFQIIIIMTLFNSSYYL